MTEKTQKAIESGKTVLGIEFGSTRIKAVLIGEDHAPIASGSYDWENQYENGIWTYSLEDVWTGLQESYRKLSNEVFENYSLPLQTIGAIGFSGGQNVGLFDLGGAGDVIPMNSAGQHLMPQEPLEPAFASPIEAADEGPISYFEVPSLEDDRPQTCAGQIGRVDQTVVPTADDDGVIRVGRRHQSSTSGVDRLRSGS